LALKNVLGAALISVFIVFVIQNLSQVTVNFLVFTIIMPRAVLLSGTLLMGIVIGIMLPFELRKSSKK
jgi:uncharacterized integral membrane protein